ncbi:unnamed protein product [Blepharisma stoltei]|uniref:Ubiquitin carboxyl-terminal hydrolase n=1 Tax=Blepharisma stoltei TaxID=1481888 RepID=A0AAU9K6Y7_9CILI|nr:unnamed protein product [Blepharisma stoltei]
MSSNFDTDQALEVMKWLKGEDDGVQRYRGMPFANTEWFIIDNVWLKKWKKLAGFLQEDLDVQSLGEIDNSDLIDNSDDVWKERDEVVLKNTLALAIDYEIIPRKAWKYFSEKYGCKDGSEISRKSIEISGSETQVEVKYKPIKTIVWRGNNWETDNPVTIFISRKAWIRDFRHKFRRIMREKIQSLIDDDDMKIWKLDPTVSLADLKNLAKADHLPIKFPGKSLDTNEVIEESEIADEDIILIEVRKFSLEWTFAKETPAKRCESCRTEISSWVECKCKKFLYCNEECKKRDSKFHWCDGAISNNQYSYQSQNNNYYSSYSSNPYSSSPYRYNQPEQKVLARTSSSKLGIVGLQNLGNTCFMNSGLQCVSNTYVLTEHLLSDKYLNEINRSNPMGTGGALVQDYAALVKDMWYGSSSSVSPWNFKRALGRFAPQFSGFNQHDSQEMVSFLLDGIHEDLNLVKAKPYVSELKTAELSETEIANLFWSNHISRNQSIIVDHMHGQYRSEVECPDCFKKSLAFDPFLMLTLPIPSNQQTSLDLVFIPYNSQSAIKIRIQVKENAYFKEVKHEVSRLLSINPNCIVLAELSHGYNIERFIDDDERVLKNAQPYAYQTPEITNDDCVVQISFIKETRYLFSSSSPAGFQRFIVLNKNSTIENLHHAIFEFVANIGNIELYPNLREKFNQSMPSLIGGRDSDIFSLKLINPYQKKNYYGKVKQCPYCLQTKCNSCPLPYTEEPLINYFEKSNEKILKVEVTFSKNIGFSLITLSSIETHVSCQENIKPRSTRVTLYDCLHQFSQPEKLDQDNTTYCSKCEGHKRGLKKMDIYKLPNILIIHLKRFKHSQYSYNSKNDKLVEFPVEGLDMGRFSITRGDWIYDLYAISNHYGSLDGGHYTAYAKNHENGRWYEFDDSHVSPISEPVENTLIKSSAYVLFYKKR